MNKERLIWLRIASLMLAYTSITLSIAMGGMLAAYLTTITIYISCMAWALYLISYRKSRRYKEIVWIVGAIVGGLLLLGTFLMATHFNPW